MAFNSCDFKPAGSDQIMTLETLIMIIEIVLMVLSAAIIILTLLQSGHTDGLSAAFTGAGDLNLFAVHKERGPEKVLSRLTLIAGILFFAIVLLMQAV